MKSRYLAIKLICLFVILTCLACAGLDTVKGRRAYNAYTLSDEVVVGNAIYNLQLSLIDKSKINPPKYKKEQKRLQEIVNNLALVSHLPIFNYEVTILDTPEANAAAIPGGRFMVNSGLWEGTSNFVNMNDQDGIAFILAHEMAHATARHTTEQMSRTALWNNFLYQLNYQLAMRGYGGLAQSLSDIVVVVGSAVYLKHSRADEYEADGVGLIYAAMAGYNPENGIAVWERKRSTEARSKAGSFDTHPAWAQRISNLRRYLPKAMDLYSMAKSNSLQFNIPDSFDAAVFYKKPGRACGIGSDSFQFYTETSYIVALQLRAKETRGPEKKKIDDQIKFLKINNKQKNRYYLVDTSDFSKAMSCIGNLSVRLLPVNDQTKKAPSEYYQDGLPKLSEPKYEQILICRDKYNSLNGVCLGKMNDGIQKGIQLGCESLYISGRCSATFQSKSENGL